MKLLPAVGVKTGDGLVKDEDPRLPGDHAGNRHSPSFPAGKGQWATGYGLPNQNPWSPGPTGGGRYSRRPNPLCFKTRAVLSSRSRQRVGARGIERPRRSSAVGCSCHAFGVDILRHAGRSARRWGGATRPGSWSRVALPQPVCPITPAKSPAGLEKETFFQGATRSEIFRRRTVGRNSSGLRP